MVKDYMVESKKKFALNPFRTYVQMDRSSAEEIWSSLRGAIDEIHNRNASCLSFEDLYRSAYNLVLHKHGTLLYEGVSEKLSSQLLGVVEKLAENPNSTLLLEVAKSFSEHEVTMVMVRDILMYMDRTYVQQNRRRPIYELGLHLYRITVWEHPRVQFRVTELLLKVIADERGGVLTDDRTLLKSVLTMLQELGSADNSNIYERDFDEIFLGTTQEFYRNETSNYLSLNTASDYVKKAQCRLQEEKTRVVALSLPPMTEGPLQNILEKELIEHHAFSLVNMENSGFAALLKCETKTEEMKNMYDLLVRVPSSVDFIRDALSERVKIDGKDLIADQEKGVVDPSAFVRGVLKMRERYSNIVDKAFRGEKKAIKRLKESFEDFLNEDARAASCLSVYVDELLRTGLKGASETDINLELQKVIVIFRYLSDKDVFESYYRQHVAKRLLAGRSVSDDVERAMVSQLKAECGYQFTSKLEGMFNDISISKDTREAFKRYKLIIEHQLNHKGGSITKPMDIEVNVLTTGYWPSQNLPACTLPAPVTDAIDQFSDFYLEKHSGRKLFWQTSAGTAEIRATFGAEPYKYRRHDLCVSTYQMCILMLFNDKSTLTLGQIRSQTHIPNIELRRHLISLCTPKHRILRKGSKGKGISNDDDTFTFNNDYTSRLKRVRIPLVSMKDNTVTGGRIIASNGTSAAGPFVDAAGGAIPSSVEEDRRHLVDAATVRIMKSRKSSHHNDLIAEVTRQLSVRFQPTPHFIKKRIESLIEREYLERSSTDRRVYMYVA